MINLIYNIFRWLTCWLPLWFFSNKLIKGVWLVSPYHFPQMKRFLDEYFSNHNCQIKFPLIICDASFGKSGYVTRFDPPLNHKILTIVTTKSDNDDHACKIVLSALNDLFPKPKETQNHSN